MFVSFSVSVYVSLSIDVLFQSKLDAVRSKQAAGETLEKEQKVVESKALLSHALLFTVLAGH